MNNKKQICNNDFETARKQHLELIRRVSHRYSGSLTPEELSAAGDIALWRCLQSYDPQYKQQVASSLYRFIHWECLRAIQEHNKHNNSNNLPIIDDMAGDTESMSTQMILDDYLSLLTQRERRIVEARFLENRTFAEIATTEGYTKQGIKCIVDRSIVAMSEAAQ